eukprot:CAMPEP_0204577638 /NCGR_PEP_ID=MMETSP0661-20131031/42462_1 /ASSEMBLY_ACC=CAM_ASM_000606 /TAXON_ID=109239 /ORGANISM="Alexandrium margalefi, Strain AMGDE01CS-322" /LENGTH=43 /DNA_ID= /DNA_START= /DNA_END= /DNA_ORIENTATION=
MTVGAPGPVPSAVGLARSPGTPARAQGSNRNRAGVAWRSRGSP